MVSSPASRPEQGPPPDLRDAQLLVDIEASCPSGSWWLAAGSEDPEWSPEMYEIFGVPAGRRISRAKIEEILHPDDRERILRLVGEVEARGGTYSAVYRIIRADGDVRLVESRGWLAGRTRLGGLSVGVVTDLTEAARLARRRRLAAEQRELILRVSGDGICGLDAAGRIEFFNPAFVELLRRPEGELVHGRLHELVHRRPDGAEPHPLQECPYHERAGGRHHGVDPDFRAADGTELEVSYTRVGHREGAFDGIVLSLRDATAARAAGRRLERSLEQINTLSAQRGELLGQLAEAEERERLRIAADIHDDSVQTLRALELVLERRRDSVPDERSAELLEDSRREVEVAATRLRGLMFELMPPMTHTSLGAALTAFCESFLAGTGIGFAVVGDVPGLAQDRLLLAYRLVQEVVRNARTHSRGTRIEITLEAQAKELRVVVADDGVGIADAAEVGRESGGLRIVRQRIEAAGGHATLGPGPASRGLAFEMRLPVAEHHHRQRQARPGRGTP